MPSLATLTPVALRAPLPVQAAPGLGRSPDLQVRLANSEDEVRAAQALRYRVFYEEGSAAADAKTLARRRDVDRFDAICDHLIVLDGAEAAGHPRIVGTYRLLRQEAAERHGGFYSAGEFDVEPLLARQRAHRFLELGRSCVLRDYRSMGTVELLWGGIWSYARAHRITAMFGCVSLPGTDPDALAQPLGFLGRSAAAPPDWSVRPVAHRHVALDRFAGADIDPRTALAALPPLLRAYLRIGARFGDGAVVDAQFGTTDVFAVLPVAWIAPKYLRRYGGA